MAENKTTLLEKYKERIVLKCPNPFKTRNFSYRVRKPMRKHLKPQLPLRYHWKTSIPAKWKEIAGEAQFVPAMNRTENRRNSLSFLSETHKYICSQYYSNNHPVPHIPSKFETGTNLEEFPLRSVGIYMRRKSCA